MANTADNDQTQLLQALLRDLTTALADLKKIKDKLGIDQPLPLPIPPSPGPPAPQPPGHPPGGPHPQ